MAVPKGLPEDTTMSVTVNISGIRLNGQELRNTIYSELLLQRQKRVSKFGKRQPTKMGELH